MSYKVGDEVLVKGKIDNISLAGNLWINFEDWHLYLSESCIHSLVKASTAIPEGWNSVDLNPHIHFFGDSQSTIRSLHLLRADGTQGYGWKYIGEYYEWYGETYDPRMEDIHNRLVSDTITDVIAWKELENLDELLPKKSVRRLEGWNTRESLENQSGKNWTRNVQVILDDGTEGYGYHRHGKWNFRKNFTSDLYKPGDACSMSPISSQKIVGWKELEPEKPTPVETPTYRLKVGDIIVHRQHHEYGVGTITELDYNDHEIPYFVNFLGAGEQWVAEPNAVKVDL